MTKKMLTFQEWRKKIKEMATIVTKKDCNQKDYQVQGAVCEKPKKLK